MLSPTSADKERTLFTYTLSSTITPNICPAQSFSGLFWIGLFWCERRFAFQHKNMSIWVTRKDRLRLPLFFLECIHSVWQHEQLLQSPVWHLDFPDFSDMNRRDIKSHLYSPRCRSWCWWWGRIGLDEGPVSPACLAPTWSAAAGLWSQRPSPGAEHEVCGSWKHDIHLEFTFWTTN